MRVCAGWSEALLVAHTIVGNLMLRLKWFTLCRCCCNKIEFFLQICVVSGLKYFPISLCVKKASLWFVYKVSKGAKIRNRYNQVPHLTQDTNGKVTGDHKAHINRRAQNIANTRQNKNIKDPQKKYRLGTVSKIFYWRASTGLTAPTSPLIQMWIQTHRYLVCMKDP